MTKLFLYRSLNLTMQFCILFHRQSLGSFMLGIILEQTRLYLDLPCEVYEMGISTAIGKL